MSTAASETLVSGTMRPALFPRMAAHLKAASFLADFSSVFISRLASKLMTSIVIALAARRLGPHTFGTYVAIVTYVGMAASLVDFGLAPYVARTISGGTAARRPLLIAATIRVAIAVVLVSLAAAASFVWRIGSLVSPPVLYVGAAMFIDLLTDLLLAALRGYGKFASIARTTVVRSLVSLLAVSAFALLTPSLSRLTLAFLISSAAGLGYTAWQARQLLAGVGIRIAQGNAESGHALLSSALRATWGYGVAAILCSAYMRLGPAVLAHFGGEQVGIYGAASKIVEGGLFATSIVCSILVPYLSATRAVSQRQFRQMAEACTRLILFPCFLLANFLIVAADPLIALLFGPKFAGAGPVLEVLSLFLLLGGISGGAQNAMLVSLGEMQYVSWLTALTLAVGLPLNLVLAGRYGAVGAAAASCLGETLLLVANLIRLERRGLDTQSRPVILCVALTAIGIFAQHMPSPLPLLVPILYAAIFGWKCQVDLRWSVKMLSSGRQMMAHLRCEHSTEKPEITE